MRRHIVHVREQLLAFLDELSTRNGAKETLGVPRRTRR
jgi:hypothetical protein